MKITDIRFGTLRVPLHTPFKTALRTIDQIEDIVVMVRTDCGRTGYGEAPATAVITGDTRGSIVEAIRHYIWHRVVGQDGRRVVDVVASEERAAGCGHARSSWCEGGGARLPESSLGPMAEFLVYHNPG